MMEKELEQHIKTELLRIKHWLGFPTERTAMRDYVSALGVCPSPQSITRLMDEVVQIEWAHFPSAAALRQMAYVEKEKVIQKRANCPICEGVGYVTIWQIVTFIGENSLAFRRIEDIPDIPNEEQAYAFQRKMLATPCTENQIVRSAARKCQCHKAAHG
jgi:hypothetical protein